MATRNERDELQYHNKENQDKKLNNTDANDNGDNATAHFTACVAPHNWACARKPVPCTFSSHSHLAQVRASSALWLHHHGHPCGCYLFDLTSSFYLFTFLLSVFLFPFFHLSDEQQPGLNKKIMENLRHFAANGGEDTYDVFYLSIFSAPSLPVVWCGFDLRSVLNSGVRKSVLGVLAILTVIRQRYQAAAGRLITEFSIYPHIPFSRGAVDAQRHFKGSTGFEPAGQHATHGARHGQESQVVCAGGATSFSRNCQQESLLKCKRWSILRRCQGGGVGFAGLESVAARNCFVGWSQRTREDTRVREEHWFFWVWSGRLTKVSWVVGHCQEARSLQWTSRWCALLHAAPQAARGRAWREFVSPSSRAQVVVLAVGVRDALFKPIAVDETPCTSWSRRSVDEMRKCGGCVEVPCWDVLQRGSCLVVFFFF